MVADIHGLHMFKLVKKLKALKWHLNKMNWKNGSLFDRVTKLRDQVKAAQLDVEKNPHDADIKVFAAKMLGEYNEAIEDEEKLLYQCAKVEWLCEGDKNSAYFHKVVKSKKSKNRVLSIKNSMGNYVDTRPKTGIGYTKYV